MPARAKGPRLWQRKGRRGDAERQAHWIILDGRQQRSTGCRLDDIAGAERALARYIADKHVAAAGKGSRHPAQIPLADVIHIYARDVVKKHARPKETAARLRRLLAFFGNDQLSEINGARCRQYGEARGSGAARRELDELRAAINHHRSEGLCAEIVGVALPERGIARERWLTRSEAARLILAAWRYREIQKGVETDRRSRRHVARFILAGIYTGTRAAAICGAGFAAGEGRGWIDLERGVFYRRAAGARETKKRQPPVRLPDRLLAHLRRWQRSGQESVVEFDGAPVKRISKAFRATARAAGLPDVTPHTLRHTAATWLMQEGVDLWEASGFLGMTVEVLSDTYGHHHPRHYEHARNAIGRGHRGKAANASAKASRDTNGTERSVSSGNVAEIRDYVRG